MTGICWMETKQWPEDVFGLFKPAAMTELFRCGVARHQDPGDYPSGAVEQRRNGPHRNDR
ncbi:hypothetical protein GGE65_007820 [Skermanella aerolata]